MGEQDVDRAIDEQQQRAYMKALLDDLRALELMLEGGILESGVRRVGSEQEMFLVDSNLGAAPVAEEVLAHVKDERFVAEAVELMRRRRIGSLPVVEGGRLVGIVTVYDFLEPSARLSAEKIDPDGQHAH
jgi:CBS-domain-containing membrane protein